MTLRLCLLVLVSTSIIYGQAATTGTLQGTVVDSSGGVVPDATITLRQQSTGAPRVLTTNDAGQFQAARLPVGEYSLRVEKSGFNAAVVEALAISVGQTVTQRITMTPAAVTGRIDVQEEADALRTSATTADVALRNERIEEAPAQNRNYLNFVLVAPGVASSAGTNTSKSAAAVRNPANDSGFVFAGMRGRNNSIMIDGMDNRDETTGGNRVAVGLEMVQEFRVSGTEVSAEFGGAAGGLVNVVTHAGQNIWHGDFTFFHQNEALSARNPEVETPERPRQRRYQPGVSTGGPIRRDRTFFFTAFEQSWESVDEWSDAPRRYLAPINAALAGKGIRPLVSGLFPSGENDTEFSIKSSHLLNSANILTTRYAFSRGRVRRDVQSTENFTDWSARGSSLITDHSLVASWSSTLSPRAVNDLRMQWAQRGTELTPNSAGPMYEIPGLVTFGQSYRLDQQRTERHAELVESFQWSQGPHLLSAGASVHGVSFDGRLANRFHGIYVYPTLDDFLAGRQDITIQAFGDPHTAMRTVPVGLWFEDHWQIATGMTFEAGVRYDRQWLPAPFPSHGNVAPRLGIAWHPGGNSGWVLRAGAGLFYDRYPLAFLNDAIQKDGVHGFERFVYAGAAPTDWPYRVAPGFDTTYSEKVTFGVERRLDRDTTLTAEYSSVRGIHLPRTRQYWLEQTARSAYQGLSISLNRRLTKDLTYLVSYNISSTHDDASDFDEQPMFPENTRADWALSRQHQRNRFSLSGLYEPIERLTFAPVFAWGSGRPLNTLLTADPYRTFAYPIAARPFGFPRNSQFAPRTVSADLRIMKTILVHHERAWFQFGVESFNLLNHTNRLRVSPYYTSTFGAMVEAQNPRQVQIAVQLEY